MSLCRFLFLALAHFLHLLCIYNGKNSGEVTYICCLVKSIPHSNLAGVSGKIWIVEEAIHIKSANILVEERYVIRASHYKLC